MRCVSQQPVSLVIRDRTRRLHPVAVAKTATTGLCVAQGALSTAGFIMAESGMSDEMSAADIKVCGRHAQRLRQVASLQPTHHPVLLGAVHASGDFHLAASNVTRDIEAEMGPACRQHILPEGAEPLGHYCGLQSFGVPGFSQLHTSLASQYDF